jgi:predicted amidophosphoribosyltransferase
MNLLELVLDIFFPIAKVDFGGDTDALDDLKVKPSLNNDYNINVILDYADIESTVHRIKNDGEFAVASSLISVFNRGFGKVLEKSNFNSNFEKANSVITFVPPDPLRKLQREFCLAKFLSRSASSRFGIPFEQLLVKPKSTAKQSYLNREQRIENMNIGENIFRIKQKFSWSRVFDFRNNLDLNPKHKDYKTIFLIDDIVTTGATIEVCYQVLKKSYPDSEIVVVVLASNY